MTTSSFTAAFCCLCRLCACNRFPYYCPQVGDQFPLNNWVGYFSTNPWFKRNVRVHAALAHATRKLAALCHLGQPAAVRLNEIWKALGEAQHHDAITGTSPPMTYWSCLPSSIARLMVAWCLCCQCIANVFCRAYNHNLKRGAIQATAVLAQVMHRALGLTGPGGHGAPSAALCQESYSEAHVLRCNSGLPRPLDQGPDPAVILVNTLGWPLSSHSVSLLFDSAMCLKVPGTSTCLPSQLAPPRHDGATEHVLLASLPQVLLLAFSWNVSRCLPHICNRVAFLLADPVLLRWGSRPFPWRRRSSRHRHRAPLHTQQTAFAPR